MSDHARLSPSSAHRWYYCAAAPNREAGFPDKDSPESLRGTAAHALLEMAIKGEISLQGLESYYHKATDITLDQADIAAVIEAYNYVKT